MGVTGDAVMKQVQKLSDISVANKDKRTLIFPIKRLADLGFTIVATAGTIIAVLKL